MFEGTPSEVVEAMKAMREDAAAEPAGVSSELAYDAAGGGKAFVSTEVARKAFKRRPLSKEQKKLLKRLASAHPGWTPITALQAEVGYSPAQLAGLLGAFGRRISHTDGYVPGSWTFDCEWSEAHSCWAYKLPDTVLEAVRLEKLA